MAFVDSPFYSSHPPPRTFPLLFHVTCVFLFLHPLPLTSSFQFHSSHPLSLPLLHTPMWALGSFGCHLSVPASLEKTLRCYLSIGSLGA